MVPGSSKMLYHVAEVHISADLTFLERLCVLDETQSSGYVVHSDAASPWFGG